MAKKAKDTQTDFTRAGKAISDTAVPYYQSSLGKINQYVQDPSGTLRGILNDFYTNNQDQLDFYKNYNRLMSNAAANNYSATGGGYSSAGQRAYADTQRYANDAAARLYQQGINNAGNLANSWFNQALAGNQAFNQAYGLGQPYSDIERYNYQVDQINSPWMQMGQIGGNILQGVGGALSLVPGVGTVVGAGLSAGGKALSGLTDISMGNIGDNFSSATGAGNTSGWANDFAKQLGTGINTNLSNNLTWYGTRR